MLREEIEKRLNMTTRSPPKSPATTARQSPSSTWTGRAQHRAHPGRLRRRRVANRPHIKTHKSPMLAKLQIAAGAKGITCQKLGEAEVMAEAGIDDIPDQLQSHRRREDGASRRAAAKANMTVAADNSTVIAGLPQAAALSGRPLSVVVECDTGRKRAGVETPAEPSPLAREIAASKD